jgi:transcription elongation factor GreA
VRGRMAGPTSSAQGVGMADHEPSQLPANDREARVQLTAAEYDRLVHELETLRRLHQQEVAGRLRDARSCGSPGDNDEALAAFEDAIVEGARITQLEDVLRAASIVDHAVIADGCARLGSRVVASDDNGRQIEFDLVGRRHPSSGTREVSLASPVGKALLGARAGDIIHVRIPTGRERTLTVLEVESRSPADVGDVAQAA